MPRRAGINLPRSTVEKPELYDVSAENYARMQQNVQQNFEAARSATSAVAQANAQKWKHDVSKARMNEQVRAAKHWASQSSGDNVLGGIGQLVSGLMGGIAASQEAKARQQQLQFENELKERDQSLDEAKFQYQMYKDQTKEQKEYEAQNLTRIQSALDTELDKIQNALIDQTFGVSRQEGYTQMQNMFKQVENEEFQQLLTTFPDIRQHYQQRKQQIIGAVRDKNYTYWKDQMETERTSALETMQSKFELGFISNLKKIENGASLWSETEAFDRTQQIINEGIQLAQNDPQFGAAVQKDPTLMTKYVSYLVNRASQTFTQYAGNNAELQSHVARLNSAAVMLNSLEPMMNTPEGRKAASEVLAGLGFSQWTNPEEFPTTQLSTMKARTQQLNELEKLAVAQEQNNPVFSFDSPQYKKVFNANSATALYDALNGVNGASFESELGFIEQKLEQAERQGSSKKYYWEQMKERFSTFKQDESRFRSVKQELAQAEIKLGNMVKPPSNQAIVGDPTGMDRERVQVGGEPPVPKYSEAQIDAQKTIVNELATEKQQLFQKWMKNGINLDNYKDPTFRNDLLKKSQAERDKLTQDLVGVDIDNSDSVKPVPPKVQPKSSVSPDAPSRQSRVPVNFTGGSETNENVIRGQRGTNSLPKNKAPMTPVAPLQGGLAQLGGVGWTPFKAGTVRLVSPDYEERNLVGIDLTSTDNRVATLQGGEVKVAGSGTIVVQTPEGVSETFMNVKGISVEVGDKVLPAQTLGLTGEAPLHFEVWSGQNVVEAFGNEQLRKPVDPVQYLQKFRGTVELPTNMGVLDINNLKEYPVNGASSVFMNDNYIVSGGYVYDKKSRKIRPLTKNEFTEFYPRGIHKPEVVNDRGDTVGIDETVTFKYKDKKAQADWVNRRPNIMGLPKKFVFAAGHQNTFGQGAPKEAQFTPVVTKAIVEEGRRRGYDVEYLDPSRSKQMSLGQVANTLRDYKSKGYFAMEIHGDAAADYGRSGVILGNINNYTEAEHLLAQEFGGYDYQMHEGKLAMRTRGVPLLEVGSMNLFQDENNWEEASKEVARRYWDSLERKQQRKAEDYLNPMNDERFVQNSTAKQYGGFRNGLHNKSRMTIKSDAQRNGRVVADKHLPIEVKALLDTIAYSEGTSGDTGYQAYYGYTPHITNMGNWSPHPKKNVAGSTAAGRYQALGWVWEGTMGGNVEMNPIAQDKFAVKLLKEVGAYEDIVRGKVDVALKKASQRWTSVGGSKLDPSQPQHGRDLLAEYYHERVKMYRKFQRPQSKDPRTISNRPLETPSVSNLVRVHKKGKSNMNFGYRKLADNGYIRKSIYSVSQKTGIPMMFISDVLAQETKGFNKLQDMKSINFNELESSVMEKVRNYRQTHRRGINTVEDVYKALTQKDSVPSDLGRYAGRRYNLTQARTYHSHPRDNCPTCQSMIRSGQFIPHIH